MYISSKAWKSIVTKTVIDYDIKRWKISLPIYKSLNNLYCEITRHQMLSWWSFALDCPSYLHKVNLIVKLLFNVHGLKSCPSMFKSIESGEKRCSKCNEFQTESPCHVLFECKNSLILRDNIWRKVKEECVRNLVQNMLILDINA